jgi:hypothetical protein
MPLNSVLHFGFETSVFNFQGCKTEVAEFIVTRIVEDLKKHYETHWIKHRIPSLFSTIQDQLVQPQYFANAISHFQECNGFNVTQQVIDIYFEHIQSLFKT